VSVPSDPEAAELRRRAQELRRLARDLEASPLHSLHLWAGVDTWSSPRADECRDLLTSDQSRLRRATDDLIAYARWLERRADERDALAARVTPP
jgi:hypothetical protein